MAGGADDANIYAIMELTKSLIERFDEVEARLERIDEGFVQINEKLNEIRDLTENNDSIVCALNEGHVRSEWEKEYGRSSPCIDRPDD